MKIEFGSDTLGDDAAGDFITPAVGRSHTRQIQQDALAGGANPKFIPRLNAQNQISFTVEKEHASNAASVAFVLDHPDSLDDQATLKFTEGDTVREIADACFQSAELVGLTGRSTTVRYTFVGGPITTPA